MWPCKKLTKDAGTWSLCWCVHEMYHIDVTANYNHKATYYTIQSLLQYTSCSHRNIPCIANGKKKHRLQTHPITHPHIHTHTNATKCQGSHFSHLCMQSQLQYSIKPCCDRHNEAAQCLALSFTAVSLAQKAAAIK